MAPVPAKAIPFKKEEASAGEMAGRSVAILVVLLGVACAGVVIARRHFPQLNVGTAFARVAGAKRRLKLVETMRLGPRASIYLVQLDGRELLLAQSGDAITYIIHDRPATGGSTQESDRHA